MAAICQTFSTNPAALGANVTWNQAGGPLELNSDEGTYSVGPSGITIQRPGCYQIAASMKYQLSGARNQGTLRLLVNGAPLAVDDLEGSETYHRQAGTSPATIRPTSEISGVLLALVAGDVISCSLNRVENNTTNGTLTLVLARLSIIRTTW